MIHLAYPEAVEEFWLYKILSRFSGSEKQRSLLRVTGFKKSSDALIRTLEMEVAYTILKPRILAITVVNSHQDVPRVTDTKPLSVASLTDKVLVRLNSMQSR